MQAYIYKITNIQNNKVYIGQTIQDPRKRWTQHKYRLNKQTHDNKKLQSSCKKWGIENFYFEIIEQCDSEKRFEREKFFILQYNSIKNGYNTLFGNKIVEEWIEKDLIEKDFSRKDRKSLKEEDVYLMKSAQFLFGSLQRPMSRIFNCHSAIPYNIYYEKRYKESCARFNSFSNNKKKYYFNIFLESFSFSLGEIQTLNTNIVNIILILKLDLGMTNNEISELLNINLSKIQDIGIRTWKKERENFSSLVLYQKIEIIDFLTVYCNFYRQSVAKLQDFVERSTTIPKGSRV